MKGNMEERAQELALYIIEGCTLAGRHVHSGVTYCGANHASGYCDGSCPYYQGAASGASAESKIRLTNIMFDLQKNVVSQSLW